MFRPHFVLACLVPVTFYAEAALYDRGNGLIYDSVLNITWLQDANYAKTSQYDNEGDLSWPEAKAWVGDLEYGGYDDWRLPSARLVNPANPCYDYDGSCDSGFNNTISELGHMFYNNLENPGYVDIDGFYQPSGLENWHFLDADDGSSVSFSNFTSNHWVYWFEEEFAPNTKMAWVFDTRMGYQRQHEKNTEHLKLPGLGHYAWAVRTGDVITSAPLPASMLFFVSALLSLMAPNRRRYN